MARLLNSFNASESEKLGSFTAIPAGTYLAQIIKSELKPTKTGDGSYLQLVYQILEGDHVNRQIFARLNLQNANVQTVEIAQKTLATIAECCGVDIVEDSEQLHNIPMYINVVVKPQQAQYPEQNDIKGFSPYVAGGPAPAQPAKPPATPPLGKPPVASAQKAPPWAKK